MNGQWLGRYTGTNLGMLVIDLDDVGSHYEGLVCAYDDNESLPSAAAFIKTPDKSNAVQVRLPLSPIHPHTGFPSTWEQIGKMFPEGTNFPRYADIDIRLTPDRLIANWKTDIGTTGSSELPRSGADLPTEYKPLTEVTSWDDFKKYVTKLEHRRFIFRGQSKTRRLRTSFHRTGRANLVRFLDQDIKTLHRHLSVRTKHVFNLNIPDENGAFFNLLQHHGYPTPLLDWTFSPFVATFFAYHRLKNSETQRADVSKKVRIFVFDQKAWREQFNQIPHVTWRKPHFSIMEFIAIDNERLIPQQSISTVTNIDDVESYIRSTESATQQYLRVIDLPMNERPHVMKELSIMGITAGSLFPGLDGTCEELRERFFDL